LRDVLRLRVGDHVSVLDNTGWEYEIEITGITRSHVTGAIYSKRHIEGPITVITLYQALLKSSNFNFVLQKCTEIGVSSFVPLICERCVAKAPDDKKQERWHKIITEAAEQSRRDRIPTLEPALDFKQACQIVANLSLLAWEGETASDLRSLLQSKAASATHHSVNLFIGPEGGFSPDEVDFAQHLGIVPITLGRRVLRAETAGLVAATAILYEYGDLSHSAANKHP
jgi:16S rRNA (uracil1498-N3)-methyltransferase